MIKAKFYCNIFTEDGELIEESFDFDSGEFKNREELNKYMTRCGYEVGEPCGYWGNQVGRFDRVITDEII